MAQIRVFNPAYTPRSYFAGAGQKGGSVAHHKKHYRRHHRRHNPFGLTPGTFKDAAYVAGGALGSMYLPSLIPSFNAGWTGVGATAVSAVALSFAGKLIGGAQAGEEVLKGGLAATIIRAVKQVGILQNVGMGTYARSYFTVPTASDAYGRSPFPQLAAPGKGAAATVSGLGATRFRSRYH